MKSKTFNDLNLKQIDFIRSKYSELMNNDGKATDTLLIYRFLLRNIKIYDFLSEGGREHDLAIDWFFNRYLISEKGNEKPVNILKKKPYTLEDFFYRKWRNENGKNSWSKEQ